MQVAPALHEHALPLQGQAGPGQAEAAGVLEPHAASRESDMAATSAA